MACISADPRHPANLVISFVVIIFECFSIPSWGLIILLARDSRSYQEEVTICIHTFKRLITSIILCPYLELIKTWSIWFSVNHRYLSNLYCRDIHSSRCSIAFVQPPTNLVHSEFQYSFSFYLIVVVVLCPSCSEASVGFFLQKIRCILKTRRGKNKTPPLFTYYN